jgi:hypothetical protein
MPLPEWKDLLTALGFFAVLVVWFSIIFLLIFALTACAVTRIEGECVMSREITTVYACEPGGKIESFKTQPQPPE